ncbi:MAG: mandelate racemase/muconate lactonizing enzyme family protein [Nitrospinota bacterium]|nr:MAG: mandelate racemase/muconate lactonizing enzyme family protein [Nitrospinota bacterium]
MKIVDVQAIPLAIPLQKETPSSPWSAGAAKQIVVKVVSDEGVVGLGEAFALGTPLAVCNVIEEGLKPYLLGADPTQIEALLEKMYRGTFIYGRRGLAVFAISGVEIALWDLVGKLHGLPVSALLGGSVKTRLRAYASLLRYERPEEVVEMAQKYVEQGFTALKLHQTDVASVQAVRKAVGDEIDLMVDINCAWDPQEAIRKAREFAEYNLYWLEEPVWPPEDYRGLAAVAAAVDVPIATGENESTHYGFREIITQQGADVLQPSLTKVGGLLETKKICHLAASWNIPVAPHSFYYGAGLAATLHLVASTPGCLLVEFPATALETPLLAEPLRPQKGCFELSSQPGLGIELNEAVIEHYPYRQDLKPFHIA